MPSVAAKRDIQDRERARARILKAAASLFAQRGVSGVTYGDIARRARLSRPLVYFYFPRQECLVHEVADAAIAELERRFGEAAAAARSGLDAVDAIGRAYLRFLHDRPDEARVMMMEQVNRCAGDGGSAESPCDQGVFQVVVAAVRRGLEDGSIRIAGADPQILGLNLWAFTHGLAEIGSAKRKAIEEMHGTPVAAFLESGFALVRRALGGGPDAEAPTPVRQLPRAPHVPDSTRHEHDHSDQASNHSLAQAVLRLEQRGPRGVSEVRPALRRPRHHQPPGAPAGND